MPHFTATIRHGAPHRYHTETFVAENLEDALRDLPGRLPEDVLEGGDLVELREAVDPEKRAYLGE